MDPTKHLPIQDPNYSVNRGQFPPALTAEAQKCQAEIPPLHAPVKQPGDLQYPSSSQSYIIGTTKEIYKGEFYNGKPHGFGELYTPTNEANAPNSGLETVTRGNTIAGVGGNSATQNNNATYASDPSLLQKETYIQYVGGFQEGQKHGYGRAIYPDGSIYMGEWLNNLPHGKGKLKSLNTTEGQDEFYDGDWKAGQMDGLGMQRWRDGTTYQGGFTNGRKHGKGVFSWPDGNKYEGGYKEDLRDGFGSFTW
jgi:hypothetical protein